MHGGSGKIAIITVLIWVRNSIYYNVCKVVCIINFQKTESAEHRSFRRYYADMLDSIDDPTLLAARLYSVDLLSRETRKNISDLTRRQQKVSELLDAVETKIGQDTDNFYEFLEALEHISMHDLCGKLRSKCGKSACTVI